MADKDKKDKEGAKRGKRKRYIVPIFTVLGTLAVSKVAFASTNT